MRGRASGSPTSGPNCWPSATRTLPWEEGPPETQAPGVQVWGYPQGSLQGRWGLFILPEALREGVTAYLG